MTLAEAIQVFGRGFSFTRSFTHPYEFVQVGPLWVMRDAPRRREPYRLEEILAHGMPPGEAVKRIRDYGPRRYALCAIEPPEADHDAIKQGYKRLGYRLLRREPFMVKAVVDSDASADPRVVRVLTPGQMEALNRATGRRAMRPELLRDDAPLRQYMAFEDGEPVGWVRSVQTSPTAAWVAGMYVRPEFRRRGLATALLSTMLADDRRFGVEHSVLLASNAGSKLYPTLGYDQIGLLQLFMPAAASPR